MKNCKGRIKVMADGGSASGGRGGSGLGMESGRLMGLKDVGSSSRCLWNTLFGTAATGRTGQDTKKGMGEDIGKSTRAQGGGGASSSVGEIATGPSSSRRLGLPPVVYADASTSEKIGQTVMLGGLWAACNIWMYGLNSTQVRGSLAPALLARTPRQALITVSNHVASMDDPLVISAVTPAATALNPAAVRWTLCATDRCFKKSEWETFFRIGKVLPVERGGGMDQEGLQAAAARIQEGDWVHFFPEGTRGQSGRMSSVKRGIGKLVYAAIADTSTPPPLLVPIYHRGLESVVPRGQWLPLSVGHQVQIVVGEPIDLAPIVEEVRRLQGVKKEGKRKVMYDKISTLVSESLERLQQDSSEEPQMG